MANEKEVENKINLDSSVSEQIADMQLMYLRQAAFNRVLSFDEIKTLEILTKVKNVEEEKRQPEQVDPKKAKALKLAELAANTKLVEAPKADLKEVEDDKAEAPISKS